MFALSNGHIGLRGNLDEGEPVGAARHLPELVLRDPAAALRRGRLRLPRVGPDASSTSPTARSSGCSSTTSRSTSATATLRSPRARCSTCAPASCGAATSSGSRRPARRCASARRGSSRSRSARSRRSCTRSSRSTAPRPRRRPVGAGRERAAPATPTRTRAPRPRSRRRSSPSVLRPRRAARRARALARERASCGWRPAMDHVVDGAGRAADARRELGRTSAGSTVAADLEPGQRAADRQVPRLRLVEPALAAGAPRPGRRRARGGAAHRLGRPRRRAARVPRRVLGPAPTSSSTATPSSSRRCASRSSTRSRPARAPSSGRSPAKGLTGPGYDGHTFWDTERFVLPVLTYTAPRAAARRAALAPLDARPRPRARRPARPRRRRVPVADDPRPGVLRLLAGGHGRVPRQRRDRRRRAALPGRDRRRGVRARGRRRAARRDGAAVALARPPRRRRAASASTASPARTSTARSPTTTSTRTCSRRGTSSAAADAVERHPAARGGARRRRRGARLPGATAAGSMLIPYDEASASTRSRRGSPSTSVWDFAATPPDDYPLLLHYPYFDLYRKQVVKQADLVLALHVARRRLHARAEGARLRLLRGAHGARLVAVRVRRRRSIAAEVGHLDLAYDYFAEAALMDLHDLEHNTRDGIHIASLAGAWLGRGRRLRRACATSAASSPSRRACLARLQRLAFRLVFRGPQARGRGPERARDATSCSRARRSRSPTTARTSRSRPRPSAARSRRCRSAPRRASPRAGSRGGARTREGAVARALSRVQVLGPDQQPAGFAFTMSPDGPFLYQTRDPTLLDRQYVVEETL